MAHYFDNFGIMQYNNAYCRNILSRTALTRQVLNNNTVFYPYEIKEGERPDTLSFLYYKKSSLEWLIFFSNQIIDPYYQWYLNDEQFVSFIKEKYGSIANAQTKTKHFEINWIGSDVRLTTSSYNNLPANTQVNLKKYWQPVYDEYDNVVYYKRKKLDTISNTNKTISISMDKSSQYIIGEEVYQQDGGVITAVGAIKYKNNKQLTLQHIQGTFILDRDIIGNESAVTDTPSSIQAINVNIPEAEASYWRPVSYFDYEVSENERKKALRIIDVSYATLAEDNLKSLMK